eukprot:TRINITY_DN65868_c0_g1_i1.p1 TRINITY_DN65868_c0_g1~~TRINITY_DN65868_c0_g1_i1.p1  ORF type:complete len:193 (+),score=66.95 TRINITY_DN65868_c0_g1_i1:39-581(+)
MVTDTASAAANLAGPLKEKVEANLPDLWASPEQGQSSASSVPVSAVASDPFLTGAGAAATAGVAAASSSSSSSSSAAGAAATPSSPSSSSFSPPARTPATTTSPATTATEAKTEKKEEPKTTPAAAAPSPRSFVPKVAMPKDEVDADGKPKRKSIVSMRRNMFETPRGNQPKKEEEEMID